VGEVTGRRGFGRALFSGGGGNHVVALAGEAAAGGGTARGRQNDDAIVAPKKCPLFSLFSCIGDRRYRPSV